MAITSYDAKACENKKIKNLESRSPYLTGDRVQLLSRVTEKKIMHKKTLDYVSSFPIAVNLYKANSVDLNTIRKTNKKNKKSVLTLLNEPATQKCTVSDINDSEYYSQSNDSSKPRIKKRTAIKNVRNPRAKNKDYQFRDNRYCSQINVNLNGSCSDIIKNYKGDCSRKIPRQRRMKSSCHPDTNENRYDVPSHNVWGLLRNMNRFQFVSSPPMSVESIVTPKKKKKAAKKRNNCEDTCTRYNNSVIETAEFAYISSYSVDDSSRTLSAASSIDRITVINKRDEFSKICKAFEQRFLKTNYGNSNNKNIVQGKNNVQKKRKNNWKSVEFVEPKVSNDELIEKQDNLNLITESDQNNEQPTCHVDNVSLINNSIQNNDKPEFNCSNINNKSEIDNKTECNSDPVPKDCSIYSDHSRSSKAELAADEANKNNMVKVKPPIKMPLATGRLPQLKGISRSIFRKGCKDNLNPVTIKKTDKQKETKQCLVTAMPRACAIPKLSENEVKRRIATMRFPIVVLGKDQVGSPLEVESNFDAPQFDGLDSHIWPFMMDWYDVKPLQIEKSNTELIIEKNYDPCVGQLHKKGGNVYPECNAIKLRKHTNEEATTNYLKNKKHVKTDFTADKTKTDLKRPVVSPPTTAKLLQSKKQKPIAQIKDRMLNLLFQKLSDRSLVNDNCITSTGVIKQYKSPSPMKQLDCHINNEIKPIAVPASPKRYKSPPIVQDKKTYRTGFGYPWAKAKWASDFIENVIKKVKNGVYYSQDKCLSSTTQTLVQVKPASAVDEVCSSDFSPKVTITKKHLDAPKTIPGFDNSLPVLEIKTLNKNQISIRHCVSNVTMQFDVSVLVQTKQILVNPKTSLTLIPVDVTGSQTKIFKCDTTILNAMLPAELCSILPKMISQFEFAISSNLHPVGQAVTCPVTKLGMETRLSTITEAPRNEPIHSSLTLFDFMSPNKKKILKGMFSIVKEKETTKVLTPSIDFDLLMIELLPKMFFKYTDILDYTIKCLIPDFSDVKENKESVSNQLQILPVDSEERVFNSSALQLYTNNNKRLTPPYKLYDFATTIGNILNGENLNKFYQLSNINILGVKYDGKLLNVQMKISDNKGIQKNVSIAISNLKIDTEPCKDEMNNSIIARHSNVKCIEFVKSKINTEYENKDRCPKKPLKINVKNKRKCFYRLYRKCKSMTNLQQPEKNTPLTKIETLDDFLQVIGFKKTVSCIFDDYSERKILTSIKEMNNWITEINARQALLVLLLVNKKDTSNLVRFRPIILQGIAVNRITKTSELDMEIEVIERENLHKPLPQYEGISYLPASIENQDHLLEELYWIAKTTASDYQKPFDESSEKHLKSLLAKRKTLNPSYLRVMARYVGLGLLKSPAKKKNCL